MPKEQVERRLAAILAADVAGYSRLMGADEEGTLAALQAHRREFLDLKIAEHRGRIVKTTGDGFLIEFASVVDATRCAVDVQQGIRERNVSVPQDKRLKFRIGINVGDVIIEGNDIFGDGVNIAARLEGIAEPGGIVISAIAHDAVTNRVNVEFRDLGELSLKNIERPVRAFELMFDSGDHANAAGAMRDTVRPLGAPERPSIAVRPFMVLSEDRGLEFLANGLAEDVTALLARVPGFFLISRASSFTFRNPETPTSVIAQQLGVRYVLEGSVRGAGEQVRVSTQLAEADTGRILWSGKFEAARAETLELQDDIARGIIIELEPALTRAEIAVIRRQRPDNVDAWGCYHQATGALGGSGWNERAVAEAQNFLRRALELDSNFALARAQLALLSALAQTTGLVEGSAQHIQEAVAAAEMAIADDAGSSEVLGYAGCALSDLGYRARGAEILRQAVETDPSNAQAEVALGAALAVSGELDEGIARMRHGIKLSPRDRRLGFWGWALASFLLRANRAGEALEEARIAARRDPRLHLPPILEAVTQAALGRPELAREALMSARRIRPQLTQQEIERSHGRRAARILSGVWDAN
ncbi:MAG TPA: adenylate/guanylate cyclase domain-containing protein [Xanthobacteraceae bacterium]|nr:adenylate/guanylate cyclase domain-containing protein [Xanthobacteraceae bacterium]